ncbi:MAG: DNA polymerase III subunit beta [Gammaproteobacteria bacterium]|nr:DNA polymerase III subunit beta [Gammaproteobacteria bacterium]
MNITIERSKLLPALNLVTNVVERKQTLPILSNLHISLEDEQLTLVGTDLEVEISGTIEQVQGENAAITVSARIILDIVRMLPEHAVISMVRDDSNLTVSSGRSRYTLRTLDAGDFPRIEAHNWEERFKINQIALKTLLEKTAFAMAVQDVRFYLNGLLFELRDNNLRSIATDGHRLAQTDTGISLDSMDTRKLIIPRKGITEITRFLDAEEDVELTLEMNKNHLKVTKGKTMLITKLIDGNFPDFKEVLETDIQVSVVLDRQKLIGTLNRISVLTADQFKGAKVVLESGNMRITSTNPDNEEALEELELAYSGEKLTTGYNLNYLIEAARAVTTDEIEMHFQGNNGICIIREPDNQQSVWLVMPMRM